MSSPSLSCVIPYGELGTFASESGPGGRVGLETYSPSNYGGGRIGMLELDCHRDHGLLGYAVTDFIQKR